MLLGWTDTDGYPVIAPVQVAGADERGIILNAPTGLVAPGGRRAGLLAHEFSRHVVGQHQRKHTGWLEVHAARGNANNDCDGGRAGSAASCEDRGDATREILYAPHTQSGYRLPASRPLFKLAAGYVSHRGLRAAKRAGFLDEPPSSSEHGRYAPTA